MREYYPVMYRRRAQGNVRSVVYCIIRIVNIITDHFSGPGNEISRECVSVSVLTINFELNSL